MGAQAQQCHHSQLCAHCSTKVLLMGMLPPMKSMKAGGKKAMSKGAMTKALATQHELKQKACSEVINSLVAIATAEVIIPEGRAPILALDEVTGQEERSLHHSWPLPLEDQDEASYQGWCQDHVRQRDQGEGKASEDSCEGVPSSRIEEADLNGCCSLC